MGNKDKPHYSDIISAAFLGNFNDFKKVYSRLKSQDPKNCRQIDSFGESWGKEGLTRLACCTLSGKERVKPVPGARPCVIVYIMLENSTVSPALAVFSELTVRYFNPESSVVLQLCAKTNGWVFKRLFLGRPGLWCLFPRYS